MRADVNEVLGKCSLELQSLKGNALLLTGAGGFVGSYLVECLLAWNRRQSLPCRLLLPTRSPEAVLQKYPHWRGAPHLVWFGWSGDEGLLRVEPAEFIIHAAAPADPAEYLQEPYTTLTQTADLTRQVLEFAQVRGARRLLYISSGAVYGKQPAGLSAIPESYVGSPDPGSRRSCYAEAKRYCEALCQSSGVETVVARLFCFLGPYQSLEASFAAPNFLSQSARSRRIALQTDGSALRTYCYASDLAASLWHLLLRGVAGTAYNVGSGGPVVSMLELARIIARQTGGIPVIAGQTSPFGLRGDRYIPETARLEHLYVPTVGLDDAVARTVASLRSRGLDGGAWASL